MQIVKYSMLLTVFILSIVIGRYKAKQYAYRLKELEEIKNALNIIKTKIKFTYEPIPEIFQELANNSSHNITNLFNNSINKMKNKTASISWEEAIEETICNLKAEDKQKLKTLSKLLGTTDTEGQISQIEITEAFLEEQIQEAKEEKNKNEKLYNKLGIVVGLAFVIVLI